MNKALLLRLHRWLALVFALPLLAIVLSGFVLSFEPMVVQSAIKPGSLSVQTIESLLRRHDPQGNARALFLRPQDNKLTISGSAPGRGVDIDLAPGEPAAQDTTTVSEVFGTARRIHERLLFQAGGLVTASTIAMLILILLGVLMGWPRLRNGLQGWHKGIAWFVLPLVILSPLTGLLLGFGISFSSPPPATSSPGPPLALIDAVRVLGASHDLSSLTWIRPIGRNPVARLVEDGETKTYALTREGTVPGPTSWPRIIHEGTWGGLTLAIVNLITSIALLSLLVTGIWIWARRKLRRRSGSPRLARSAPAE